MTDPARIAASLDEHCRVAEALRALTPDIAAVAALWRAAFTRGNQLLLCGNGGSAADCQHIAAELTGRFERERRAYPAIALTTDTSALTAIGNDYGFDRVFARQVQALGRAGDVLLAISTSGNSPAILNAARAARERGAHVVGLSGASGGALAALCDVCLRVPSTRTARIQEMHILIGHALCECIDADG
jgi:D-sedoheptulose 7-phosphate isomerase